MSELKRRGFIRGSAALLGAAALGACTRPAPAPVDPLPEAVRRGAAWLWAQQDARGAFSSRTFGVLSLGQTLTPFALIALSEVPEALLPLPVDAAGRALAATLGMVNADGALGLAAEGVDYPVYATSLALTALTRLSPSSLQDSGAKMRAWLQGQQLEEGWAGTPAHGGFPMGGRVAPTPPNPGHVDLSMTRRAAEALVATGGSLGSVEAFIRRCQAPDGGFVYSPVDLALNKGGCEGEVCAGYGSATCDGLLGLLALGVSPKDPAIAAGHAWLMGAHRLDKNPGVSPAMGDFAMAMRFYYRAGAAQVFASLGGPAGWEAQLIEALLAEQEPDGRWESASPLQKENDPIVATSLALTALTRCL